MTSQEIKLARISKIYTSVLKNKEAANNSHSEAYNRILESLEHCIQDEKKFNRDQTDMIKQAQDEEQKRNDLRDAMQKHYFKQLQQQISDRAAQRAYQSEKRNYKFPELKNEEGYVWKGMTRDEWRNILDSQIKEKKQIKENCKKSEIDMDKERIELAQKSLDNEIKYKEAERKKRQNDMWESWEKTKHVRKLQRELDSIRRNGDSDFVSYGMTPGKRKNDYFEDIVKGYEHTFGKIQNEHSRTASKTGKTIISSERLVKGRSRSNLVINGSYTNAVARLGNLMEEEEKLKNQKIELIKLLEKAKANRKNKGQEDSPGKSF